MDERLFLVDLRGIQAIDVLQLVLTSPPWNLQVPPYQDNFVQGLDQRLK
jgi:hypothetical protein